MYSSVKYRTLFIISIFLLIFGVGFGFIGFPKLLRKMVKSQMNVAPGSKLRPLYIKAPIFADFRVYMFNVTNKDEVIQGKKPKLQEVGPYFFEEWKEKFDVVDDEEEDTMTYHGRTLFIPRPDKNGPGLTGNEIIVMPHPMIMGTFMAVNVDKQAMLPAVETVVNNLFNNPADAFYTGTVMDLLFNGVSLDCSSDDKPTVGMCMNLEEAAAIKKIDDTHLSFSLFGGANGSDMGEYKVYRGKKNAKDLGRLISYNDDTESNAWEEDECNAFQGTDSTIFPPLITKDEVIFGYDPTLCRSLGMSYRYKSKYNGIPVLVYEADLSEDINVKQCFCRDEDTCPPKGTFDMFRCSGVPMFGSLPHFYMAEELVNGVESGLNPNKQDHGISIYIEALTGSPLSAYKRLQFSLEVKPIPSVKLVESLPELFFPLFWVEEGVSLDRDFTDPIKNSLYLMINIVKVLKWFCVIFGLVGSIGCGAMMMMSGAGSSFVLD